MLAAAYLVRSAVPSAAPLPSALSALVFHGASLGWFCLRASRLRYTSGRWVRGADGFRLNASREASWEQPIAFAVGSLLQFPLYPPCVSPFALCALLGLETAVGSNVVMLFQTVCLGLAVLFQPVLLLPLAATSAALASFGATAHRAGRRAFNFAMVGHGAFAAVAALAWMHRGGPKPPSTTAAASVWGAALSAVLCAEARVRASLCTDSPTNAVAWACRAAALGCLVTLPVRFAREVWEEKNHAATSALALAALCAPWFWDFHKVWVWRRPHPDSFSLEPLGLTLVVFLLGCLFASHYTRLG